MKILIAGDWHSELHEEAVFQAFLKLGHEPVKYAWHEYFKPYNLFEHLLRPLYKAQNKYMFGPVVDEINRILVKLAKQEQPEIIFVYRGTHIYPETLQELHRLNPRSVLIGYNNDDPFSHDYPLWKWRHFLAGVPIYDLVLAYRQHNVVEYLANGASRVELLRSWFIPERNYPMTLTDAERSRYECDVVFIGHYENDGRLAYLEEVVRRGWHLRIYGPGYEWDKVLSHSALLRDHQPVNLVWGQDYNRALCAAKIGLCFLSKLNRDTYTRRCFEIPASGALLVSEYSEDLTTLFRPFEEALYFRDISEMSTAIDIVMSNSEMRKSISQAGSQRVRMDGHDVVSRMKKVLLWAKEILGETR